MSTRRTESRIDPEIQGDFLAALSRLQNNTPKNARLQDLARRGRLKVGLRTVAEEAGHSPTLISQADCPYREVRARILAVKKKSVTTRSTEDALRDLKAANATLKRQVELLLSHNMALINRMNDMERAFELERSRFRLRSAPQLRSPNQIVGYRVVEAMVDDLEDGA